MRNIFICNTQAQLILASGLAAGRFKGDENELILFVDFGLGEDLKKRLVDTFSCALFLQSIYPAEFNTVKAKLKWYPEDWKLIKRFISGKKYDKAFAVCDWLILVQKTLKRLYRLNTDINMAWLEDGITAYYRDSDIRGGLDSNNFTRTIRRILVRDILGIGKFYDRDFREMGGLKCLKDIYTCYPDAVREPYRSQKKLVEITDEEYRRGLQSIYPSVELDIAPHSVILVVDKLDRYAYPEKVKAALAEFVTRCKADGKTIICKFHPRETTIWDIFDGCRQLDNSVGIESAYVSLQNIKETVTIVGIKSAGLMSAKKMGYKTVSLFSSCGESNDNLILFYNKLGIELI